MAIQNPWLFENLVEWMRDLDYSQHDIDMFAERWSRLSGHDPYPCPECFTDGMEGTLKALPAVGKYEPVKCRECGTYFEIPEPPH